MTRDIAIGMCERAAGARGAHARQAELETSSERRLRILAHSLYREMKAQGFVTSEIVGLASALLGELISDFKEGQEPGHDVQPALPRGEGCHGL